MSRSAELTLLVNPAAGKGRAAGIAPRVHDVLRSAGWHVELVRSTSGEHLEAVTAGLPDGRVVAVLSGDGGMARAAAGAARSGAVLAPLPAGRGDDFVRALGLARDPMLVASLLTAATERRLDLGMVGDRPFLGVASVGFDSMANAIANRTSWLPGPSVYAYAGTLAILRYRPVTFVVTVDDRHTRVRGWTVAVGNSGRYGGGMRVCPDAGLDDGMLDVVILGGLRRREFPAVLQRVFAGTHVEHPQVHSLRGRSVTVAVEQVGGAPGAGGADGTEGSPSGEPLVVYADGDPAGTLPATLTVRAAAVRVLA